MPCTYKHDQPDFNINQHPMFDFHHPDLHEGNEVVASRKIKAPHDVLAKWENDIVKLTHAIKADLKQQTTAIENYLSGKKSEQGKDLVAKYEARKATDEEKKAFDSEDDDDIVGNKNIVVNRHALLKDIVGKYYKAEPEKFHPRPSMGNTKLANEGITPFALPEIFTCPGAGSCKKLCYARVGQMAFNASVIKRWINFYATKKPNFADEMAEMLDQLKQAAPITSKDFDKLKGYVERHKKGAKFKKLSPEMFENNKKLLEQEIEQVKNLLKVSLQKDLDAASKQHSLIRINQLKAELAHLKNAFRPEYHDLVVDGKPVQWNWDAVRIHDSGDFYDAEYVKKWVAVVKKFPNIKFYAYTKTFGIDNKELTSALKELEAQPNFKLIQSVGSTGDHNLNPQKPHALIVEDDDDMQKLAENLGYHFSSKGDRVALQNDVNKILLRAHGASKGHHNFEEHVADLPHGMRDELIGKLKKAGAKKVAASFKNKVCAAYKLQAAGDPFFKKIEYPTKIEEYRLVPEQLINETKQKILKVIKENLQTPVAIDVKHSREYGLNEPDVYEFYASGYSDKYDDELSADIGAEVMKALQSVKPKIRFPDWNCDIEEVGENNFKYNFDFSVKWIRPDLAKMK